jgi:hypothetical protein
MYPGFSPTGIGGPSTVGEARLADGGALGGTGADDGPPSPDVGPDVRVNICVGVGVDPDVG